MSSGFFQHRGAPPPASWWSADVAGALEGVEAAAEEHTFASAGELLPGPDVVSTTRWW